MCSICVCCSSTEQPIKLADILSFSSAILPWRTCVIEQNCHLFCYALARRINKLIEQNSPYLSLVVKLFLALPVAI